MGLLEAVLAAAQPEPREVRANQPWLCSVVGGKAVGEKETKLGGRR